VITGFLLQYNYQDLVRGEQELSILDYGDIGSSMWARFVARGRWLHL
jgi:hypothetical protein